MRRLVGRIAAFLLLAPVLVLFGISVGAALLADSIHWLANDRVWSECLLDWADRTERWSRRKAA